MAIAGHRDPKLLSGDALVIEPELAGQSRKFRLIGGLLQKNKEKEGEQAQRESETDDPADDWNALKKHDDEGGADRVKRKMLPFGHGIGH